MLQAISLSHNKRAKRRYPKHLRKRLGKKGLNLTGLAGYIELRQEGDIQT